VAAAIGRRRRTHLRGHQNNYNRLILHASAFNPGLLMRTVLGVGTPRSLQGRAAALIDVIVQLWTLTTTRVNPDTTRSSRIRRDCWLPLTAAFAANEGALATGCQ
jgi:hypothetical protein